MSENYMDYSDDRCLNMFTQQQIGIMHAMLATSQSRNIAWVEVVTGMGELNNTSSIDVLPESYQRECLRCVRTAKDKMNVFVTNTVGQIGT
jgi:hypothetical protein